MSVNTTENLSVERLILPHMSIVDGLRTFLSSKESIQKFDKITDPLERGILVGEAVFSLLSQDLPLGHALIMKASEDEHNKLEIDDTDKVNTGIVIGLGVGDQPISLKRTVCALSSLSSAFEVEVSEIRQTTDYTPIELEVLESSHVDLKDLFPVPELALRFSVVSKV